jgi:hypothetical protein
MTNPLDQIQAIIKHDSYPQWPLRCSLSTNEIARICELVEEAKAAMVEKVTRCP